MSKVRQNVTSYYFCDVCAKAYPELVGKREYHIEASFWCNKCNTRLCPDHTREHSDAERVLNLFKC